MTSVSLAGKLRDFGLEKEEAEIYVFLSASGPTPARVVARRFSLNRMKAYRCLKGLEDRELVQRVMGRPVKFIAVPPQKIIDNELSGLKRTLANLEGNKETIIREWETLTRGVEQITKEPKFRIFQGRQQVFELLLEMFERAHDTIRLVTTTNDLARLNLWGLDDKLKMLSRKGKRIRVLTQIDVGGWSEVKPFIGFTETRHIALQTPIRFAIIDDSEALTTVAMDDSMSMTTSTDTGLWTDAPNYVAALRIFFDALWSLSPNAESVIQSLKRGEPTPEIKTYTTQEEYVAVFKEMIAKADRSIDIIVKDVTTLPINVKELEDLATEGMYIRLLIHTDEELSPEISSLADSPIVVSENAAITDLIFLAVDEREVLLNIPYAESQKRTVCSNLPAFVSVMQSVFNDYWFLGKSLKEKLLFVAQRRRVELLAQRIAEGFIGMGWAVEAPGNVKGISSRVYSFDVVATGPTQSRVFVDIVVNESIYDKIIEKSNVVSDLPPHSYFIASRIPFRTDELRLAELYRIKIIYSETDEKLISSVLSAIK